MKTRVLNKSVSGKVVALVLCIGMMTLFTACGSTEGGGSPSTEKEYVRDDEVAKVLADPESYKGKYIKLGGKVFNVDRDGDTVALQIWHDVENSENDFIAYMDTEDEFSDGDFVAVEGCIEGVYDGENAFGGEVHTPKISADSMEKSTYQDVVAPALQTKELNKSKKQHDVKVTISKVEYAASETRIYLSVKNKSKDNVSIYTNSAKLIQKGKQYEPKDNWEADYPSVDEVAPGASKEGILCFAPLDPKKKTKLILEAYSDNYDIDMKDYKFRF